MAIHITGAPCCWGVDDVNNPYLPAWQTVLKEAGLAGYKAIELGPYGYLPLDIDVVSKELEKNGISIVAGTIFDDLLSEENYPAVLKQVGDICAMITKLPPLPFEEGLSWTGGMMNAIMQPVIRIRHRDCAKKIGSA